MPARVGYLVFDAADPQSLASFWCGLLDVQVDMTIGDGEVLVLSATTDGLTVGFQQVGDTKVARNRLHLDLLVEHLDAATAEVERLRGHWLEPGNTHELAGFRWRCRTRRATSSTSRSYRFRIRPSEGWPPDPRRTRSTVSWVQVGRGSELANAQTDRYRSRIAAPPASGSLGRLDRLIDLDGLGADWPRLVATPRDGSRMARSRRWGTRLYCPGLWLTNRQIDFAPSWTVRSSAHAKSAVRHGLGISIGMRIHG